METSRRPAGQALREAVTPGWLAEIARSGKEPVPWPAMARAALAICVPLAAGLAGGQPTLGLLFAIGGLLGSVVDRDGPPGMRLRRIGCAAVIGGAGGIGVGQAIHGRGWVTVAVLIVVAGACAVISAFGAIASVTSLQLLVYAAFGTGPLGLIRPWWLVPAAMLGGVAWAVTLLLPGWIAAPQAAQQRRVAQVYRALARKLAAIGTPDFVDERRAVTAALNVAYDEVLTARSASSGRERRLARLAGLLNQAHQVAEAATALAQEGRTPPAPMTGAAGTLADAIMGQAGVPPVDPPPVDPPPGASPGLLTLHSGLAGAADLLAGRRSPEAPAVAGPGPGPRTGAGTGDGGGRPAGGRFADARSAGEWLAARTRAASQALGGLLRLPGGRLTRVFAVRLMLCVALAAIVSEVLPLQRSYWVLLTVAIVLKPDFGSVFARALQRGIGTVIGAVIGAVLLAAIPAGPLLLLPMAAFAALLPYGRSRNYGLFSVFLTPLVVLLIDLLAHAGWRLAEARLIDTVVGCLIVLVAGYGPWPMAWHADLPGHLADAADSVALYTGRALAPGADGGRGGRSPLRRQAYRALSDLQTEFQRSMAEPRAASRRATAWWPAVVALEQVMDSVTAAAVAADHAAARPDPGQAGELAAALHTGAAAIRAGQAPRADAPLPDAGPLKPAADAVRGVTQALAGAVP